MGRVSSEGVPAIANSPLALAVVRIAAGDAQTIGGPEHDSLVFVFEGSGSLGLGNGAELTPGAAALVLANEQAELRTDSGLAAIVATAAPSADRHAPLGTRETVTRLDAAETSAASSSRSFQILFGPHNGSTRATLFAGFVPPGRAPWHYHLYDEIVWIPEGPGRLHYGEEVAELGAGSAFRLRPREVHIVENTHPEQDLTIIGIFTPAGSPSAAYLEPHVAAAYRID